MLTKIPARVANPGGLSAVDLAAIDPLEIDRELARRYFWSFFQHMDPKATEGWWQRDAAERLQRFYDRLVAGERPKLALTAPPQHGKSRMIVDFVAWMLGRSPELKAIYASFSDALGVRANKRIQRILDHPIYRGVFPGTRIAEIGTGSARLANRAIRNTALLEIVGVDADTTGGYFRNTTVGGSITGESLDLGIIDDPVKGREEAESSVVRAKTWDWYNDDFRTRFSERAGMLLIMTRWHLDDLVGRMQAELDDLEIVSYRAIAEHDEPPHRKEGGALFPEFKSLEFLEAQRKGMEPSSWLSLFQQRPVPRDGVIVKLEWLANRWVVRGEKPWRVMMSIDCASKAKLRNDPSAFLVCAEFADRYELWDYQARRLEFPDLEQWTIDACAKWKPHHLLIEDKDAGQQLVQILRRKTKLPVIPVHPEADKETRLMTETGPLAAGRVWLPDDAPWVADWTTEITVFPQAPHDESADTLSQVLRWCRENPRRSGAAAPLTVRKESNRGF